MEHRSKMNILNSTLLILINKTTANVSNKVPGLEFFRLTAINTHNWSMDILRKFKVVDQLYICVCFTWIIRFMGPALYFCFIKKRFVSSLYLVHIYSVYINFVALSILQNGKLPRFLLMRTCKTIYSPIYLLNHHASQTWELAWIHLDYIRYNTCIDIFTTCIYNSSLMYVITINK